MKNIQKNLLASALALLIASTASAQIQLITAPLEDPGLGRFGSGFNNYRAMDSSVWHEKYGSGDATNTTANGREVLQDEANSSVPLAVEGEYWFCFAPDATFNAPALTYSLGIWKNGNPTDFKVSFSLGDRANANFGRFQLQLVYTDSGFTAGNGVDLATAPGYTLADTTATFTDATAGWIRVEGGRTITKITDTLNITGVANNQEVWVVLTASGNGTQSLVDNLFVTAIP